MRARWVLVPHDRRRLDDWRRLRDRRLLDVGGLYCRLRAVAGRDTGETNATTRRVFVKGVAQPAL